MSALKPDKQDISKVAIDKFTYQWKIENFKYLYKEPGDHLDSPIFTFGSKNDIQYKIRLYPNGDFYSCTGNYLSIYLYWQHKSVLAGEFRLLLIDENNNIRIEKKGDLSKKVINNPGTGFSFFIKRDEILKKESGLLPNGCLTIQCEIVLSLGEVSQIHEDETKIKIKPSLGPNWHEKLFLEEHLSDIKLIATSSGKSLSAHRNVLAACSPVFQAMFKIEKKLSEVKIENVDYEVIKEMLRFIYLNKVDNLKSIIFELTKLAHMYQITGLMEFCGTALIDGISVNNVLKVISVANSYNMEKLKNYAINFGNLHFKEVLNSNDCKSSVYPLALQSILQAFVRQ